MRSSNPLRSLKQGGIRLPPRRSHRVLAHLCASFLAISALIMVTLLLSPNQVSADASPYFVAVSAIAASTGVDVTIVIPSAWEPGDIFIISGLVKDVDDTVTATGYTSFPGSPVSDLFGGGRFWWFWKRATTSESNPLFDKSGTTGDTYAMMAVYRGIITTGIPITYDDAPATTLGDPAFCGGADINLVTTIGYSLVVCSVMWLDDNNAAVVTTSTNPRNYVEHYQESAIGTDAALVFSESQKALIGNTGQINSDFDAGGSITWGSIAFSLFGKPLYNTLISMTIENPGANCAHGGQRFDSGLDNGDGGGTADDGILQSGEIDDTAFVCNGSPGTNGTNGADGTNGTNGTDGIDGTNGTDGADGPPGPAGPQGPEGPPGGGLPIGEVAVLLLVAFGLLMVLGYMTGLPFVYIVAGIVGLFLAFQGYTDTQSPFVGMGLSSIGLVTLVGGLNEIVPKKS